MHYQDNNSFSARMKDELRKLAIFAAAVILLMLFLHTPARAADQTESAANWLTAIDSKIEVVTLCAGAKYYSEHPDKAKHQAYKLWLRRGIETAKTDSERAYCDQIKSEIDKRESAKVQAAGGLEVKHAE